MTRYVTIADIVIPAGTPVMRPPRSSSRWGKDHEAVVGHGRDHSSYWSIDIAEGLEAGIIQETSNG